MRSGLPGPVLALQNSPISFHSPCPPTSRLSAPLPDFHSITATFLFPLHQSTGWASGPKPLRFRPLESTNLALACPSFYPTCGACHRPSTTTPTTTHSLETSTMSTVVRATALRAGGACTRCRKGKTKASPPPRCISSWSCISNSNSACTRTGAHLARTAQRGCTNAIYHPSPWATAAMEFRQLEFLSGPESLCLVSAVSAAPRATARL